MRTPHPPIVRRLASDASNPARGGVVLVLPARDEAPSIAGVIARTPPSIAGRRVTVVVVDDGSTDATAAVAAAAGAVVIAGGGRGLGAAVRVGLGYAAGALDAEVVAFCDADGEYAPEELGRLVEPVVTGRADYVVGSRFDGTIHRMLRRRRLGNRVLTAAFRRLARTPITVAQSGYRALSRAAAEAAVIIHDYNYAQVLTLDLLAKRFTYCEVPISYAFRTEGTSFVHLGPYLQRVVPAVVRQLRAGGRPPLVAPGAGVLDTVGASR